MKFLALMTLACLSACSWLGARKSPPPPVPTQIVVTAAPAGALVYIDGVQAGPAGTHNNQTQVLDVTPGNHKVEIRVNDKAVYREETSVGAGERRVVVVESGFSQ